MDAECEYVTLTNERVPQTYQGGKCVIYPRVEFF